MRKLSVMLGIVAFMGVLSALWTWRQLHAERERASDLQRQVAELQACLDRPAVASPTTSAAAALAAQAPPTSTAVANTKSEPALTEAEAKELASRREMTEQMRRSADREREMMRDPAYRKARLDEMRRRFASLRADAIRVVGMTPEQADRMIDLMVERQQRFMEIAGIPGQPPSEAAQAELKRANESEQDELRKLLGDDLYAKWGRFQASGQERAEARQWRTQWSTTSEPLSDRAADALAESLYVERERRSREYEEYVKRAGIVDRNVVAPQDRQRWLDLEKEANQRTHDTMTPLLSAAQLANLDEMLAARLVPIETALRMQLEGKLANSK